ncbi:ArsR/SmtB family transcription factor [Phytoactinopolyspora halotolerans]|uniref:Winged helix-turn-helix transcriptional regulator n=1 Tax=Phytoactinopolyspora halotolerans TaxID=1981512 RepID=A0A6L9SB65_9ACTN|nr:metalloregulator ArsR/SmtB family transcription factor [Phytoactinopolyspora halotolerans]NEE02293.1 winged helix-turn-helix transcriptional regulator [Phytoactinopolyspora halotolerans]
MDEIAGAIADPVRRQILELLHQQRRSVGEIAEQFDISRPAVSRHLRVLRSSGLVSDELVGRQRFYMLHPEKLTQLIEWLARFGEPAGWERHLDALETEVYRTRRDRRTRHPSSSDDVKENTA